MSERSKYLLLLFILGGMIIFFKMGERDLWEPDETRYAVIAREMAWNGNWIVPRLNGQVYAEKPPLFFWLVNFSTFFFGARGEVAVRLPSAVGGVDDDSPDLVQQTAGRSIGVGGHIHSQSIFFYLVRFPVGFLPWSLFLPSAFLLGARKMRDYRREITLLFIWFGFIFLFFSFSKGKKDTYLLPLYPAAALLTGFLWDSEILSGRLRRGMIAGLTLLAVCLLATLVLIPLRTPEGIYGIIQPVVHLIKPILICFSLGSLIALILYLQDRKAISFLCLFATLLALHLQVAFVLPTFNSQWSMKALSERAVKRMEPGDKLKVYRSSATGLLYYTQMNSIEIIEDKNRFIEILSSPERTYLMTEQRHLDSLRKEFGIDFRIIDRARVKWWDLVLISNC